MNGALCMELLTSDGWNPINDIESVIVSIRSLLVVGDGRLEAVSNMSQEKRDKLLTAALNKKQNQEGGGARGGGEGGSTSIAAQKRSSDASENNDSDSKQPAHKRSKSNDDGDDNQKQNNELPKIKGYSTSEAKAAYSHLSTYHKKKGWSGWWAQRG